MKTGLCNCCMFCVCVLLCKTTIAQNANTSLSNLVAPVKINVVLQPDKDNKHSLGSATKAWRNLYIDSGVYVAGSKFLSAPGLYNTATGFSALASNVGGINNTANGFLALYHNTSGYVNSAFGSYALSYNTTGGYNSAFGSNSLYLNTGDNNSAFGANALTYHREGNANSAFGSYALYNDTSGFYNSAFGFDALVSNIWGYYNTAIGATSLYSNISGSYNTANGYQALYFNSTGDENTANGVFALYSNTTGYYNTATGSNALGSNTSGTYNTANGQFALISNTTGQFNTAAGNNSLYHTKSSYFNTAVGYNAGYKYDNGYNNVFVGANTDVNGAGYYNDIAIGQGTLCTDVSQARFGNSATVSIGGYANWSDISDRRVKKNIKQNVPGLAFINKLQPVTYTLDLEAADKIIQYQRKDSAGKIIPFSKVEQTVRTAKGKIIYTGFISQDVEKAAKSLNYDFSGVDAAKNNKDLYGLRYAEFVVPLVKAVQELSKQNDSLKQVNSDLETKYENQQKQIDAIKSLIGVGGGSAINNLQSMNISSASLQQNVPNPFANSTTISYFIPQKYSSAKIIVTDKNGKTIKALTIGGSGKGSINIGATTLALGAYQYALYVDGRIIDTKQMVIAK